MIRIATILLIAFPALAQIELGGLRTGYVADEAVRVLRPVIGAPGSAYLGAAVALEFPVASATVVSNGSAAIAISASDSPEAWLIRKLDESPTAVSLGPASAAFTSIRAPSAVLYSRADSALRIITSFDGAVSTGPAVPESSLGAKFRSASIDDETGCAVLASSGDGEMRIHELCPARPFEARFVCAIPGVEPVAIAYSKRVGGLLVADNAGRRVILVKLPLQAGVYETLATNLDNLVGVQPISSTRAIAVQQDSATALVLDVRSRAPVQTIELPGTASLLYYLSPDRVLALNRAGEYPLMVIDLSQDNAAYLVASAGDGK